MSSNAPETLRQIDDLVKSERVVLFMKGSRSFPQCGFSASVVQILNSLLPEYKTVNVLADANIRQGVKDYSSWPTIPQLYVDGEFVGGCDIIKEMFASGELQKKLGVEVKAVEPPAITVTPAAVEALRSALSDAGPDDHLHIAVSRTFEHDLSLGPKRPGELEVTSNGLSLLLDPMSADKLRGVTIDYVAGAGGAGFKIDNPNRPPPGQVLSIAPREFAAKMKSGELREVFDVRAPDEIRLARIEGIRPLDEETLAHIEQLDRATPIAFICHHGTRSRGAAQRIAELGFQKVYNLSGGIDAWSQDIDPNVPRY
jgi:monothiol glutaredoxin